MKIFFIASMRGRELNLNLYKEIVQVLEKTGNKVFAQHILKTEQSRLDTLDADQKIEFHKNILEGIKNSDIVVAEASYPSLSIGFLLSFSLECGKPTVVLYKENEELPNLLSTLEKSEKLISLKYKDFAEIKNMLGNYVEDAGQQMDVRFNVSIMTTDYPSSIETAEVEQTVYDQGGNIADQDTYTVDL